MKTNSNMDKFKTYSIKNLNAIIGGTGSGGSTEKKKIKIPTQGAQGGDDN